MGHYTGFRFVAQLRPEVLPAIEILNQTAEWQAVAKQFPLPGIQRWLVEGRCRFIPFGAVLNMPLEWSIRADHGHSILRGDRWHVICSLKNRQQDGPIERFCQWVLPELIAQPCRTEQRFEGDPESTFTVVLPKEEMR